MDKININVIENSQTISVDEVVNKYNLAVIETVGVNFLKLCKKIENQTKKILKTINPIIQQMPTFTNYFKELGESIKEAKKNPDSIINWAHYSNKLSEYIWAIPYNIDSSQLKEILEVVNSEEEFDEYMINYFDSEKFNSMFDFIEKNISETHSVILHQIKLAIENELFSLAIVGIMSIIDEMCSYFLADAGNNARLNMFTPIIEDFEKTEDDLSLFLILRAVSLNINVIFEVVEFSPTININTNKKARRNPCVHGRAFSNRKVDVLMLLNTMYYLLILQKKLVKYKGKVKYVRNNKKWSIIDE